MHSMKVDLSNFFKDERRQSLVFIDATWQNIKDVQDHIQNLFSLDNISLLTTDGCFLPPRESIKVLKSAEGLKAFKFAQNDKDIFVSPAPVKSSKRKNRSSDEEVHLSASTPLRPSKRSKNQSEKKWNEIVKDTSCVRPEDQKEDVPGPSVQSKRSKKKGQSKSPDIGAEITYVSAEEDAPQKRSKSKNHSKLSEVPEQTIDLKDKKSHSPKSPTKTVLPPLEEVEVVEEEEPAKEKTLSKSPNIPSETSQLTEKNLKKQKYSKNMGNKNKSLKFPANSIELEEEESTSPTILYRCPLLELDSNVARVFEFPKQTDEVRIIENIILEPIDTRFLPQKETEKEFTANGFKDKEIVDEKESMVLDNIQVPEKSCRASSIDEDEVTLPKDTTSAEITLPEESTNAEITTEAEALLPDISIEAERASVDEVTRPENSITNESILPGNTTGASDSPLDKSNTDTILPDDVKISINKSEVDSENIKHSPVRICAENLVSDSDDDVMLVDDSNMDTSGSDSDVESVPPPNNKESSDIISDLLRNATSLSDLPTKGDTIVFKLQKVKGNPRSGATDFIAGNVTYINRRTKVITLETISSPSGIGRILRQYSAPMGFDDSSDEVRPLNVQLKDIIEGKIVVATID
ncbi:coilin [Drosophila eugracilis]|uniref:coilin n=1 Tax=Drosophila eugracilis TaxID=29029 RepID=UPI0007E74343|nr:coilin [Drosophila eugracilis]XP_017072756.1 coilin [Drosophila eugracilis]